MSATGLFSPDVLKLSAPQTVDRISGWLREVVFTRFRRKGVVLGLSGGVDSSLVAALAVRALGPERVVTLLMPERESSEDSLVLGRLVAKHLGLDPIVEDITPVLAALGAYRRRDDMIRTVLPEYTEAFKCKIVLPALAQQSYRTFSLVAQAPDGRQLTTRLTSTAYLGIVAATNFKQRVRKMVEYHHADRLSYVVAGTPNRQEYDQGFFVKNGDGAADVKPIAHLYKTQVYQLAEYLGIPEEVRSRPPTTDTYSLSQSQEEFYFSLPYDQMDFCLYGLNHGVPAEEVARGTGMTREQVELAYAAIVAKRKATRYQHLAPLLVETIDEIPHEPS